MWEKNLKLYDDLVDQIPEFERKGKTMPYTSANGYMFSLLNKAAEFGIRLSKEEGENFKEKYQTTIFESYGAVMRGYVLVPNEMLSKQEELVPYMLQSYKYVMSLKPKPTQKRKKK